MNLSEQIIHLCEDVKSDDYRIQWILQNIPEYKDKLAELLKLTDQELNQLYYWVRHQKVTGITKPWHQKR